MEECFIGKFIKVDEKYFEIIGAKRESRHFVNLLLGTNIKGVPHYKNVVFSERNINISRRTSETVESRYLIYSYKWSAIDELKLLNAEDVDISIGKYKDTDIDVVNNIARNKTLQIKELIFNIDMSRDIGYDIKREKYTISEFEKEYPNLTMDKIINSFCTYKNIKSQNYYKNKCTSYIFENISNKTLNDEIKCGEDYDVIKYDKIFDILENTIQDENTEGIIKHNPSKKLESQVKIGYNNERSNSLSITTDSNSLLVVPENNIELSKEIKNLSPELKIMLDLDVKPVAKQNNVKTQILELIEKNKCKFKTKNSDLYNKYDNETTFHIVKNTIDIYVTITSKGINNYEGYDSCYGKLLHSIEIGAVEAGTKEKIILLRIAEKDYSGSCSSEKSFNHNFTNSLVGAFDNNKSRNKYMLGKGKVFQVYRCEVLRFVDNFIADMFKIHEITNDNYDKRIDLHLSQINKLILANKKGDKFDNLLKGINKKTIISKPTSNNIIDNKKKTQNNSDIKCIGFDMITYLRGDKNITIENSMKVFKFNNKSEITQRKIKIRFNKLLKIHHSDAGGTDEDARILIDCRDLLNKI